MFTKSDITLAIEDELGTTDGVVDYEYTIEFQGDQSELLDTYAHPDALAFHDLPTEDDFHSALDDLVDVVLSEHEHVEVDGVYVILDVER